MKKEILSCMAVCSFLLVGCASNNANKSYEVDNKTITINLEENGSTGYLWYYDIKDKKILEFTSEKSQSTEEESDGKRYNHEFVFTGKTKGKTKIVFEYKRDWEKDKKPEKTKIYTINVDVKGNIQEIQESE